MLPDAKVIMRGSIIKRFIIIIMIFECFVVLCLCLLCYSEAGDRG